MTPALFDALLKRKKIDSRQEYLRTGLIAATVMNFSMARPDKAATENDFIPSWLRDDELDALVDLSTLTPLEAAAYVRNTMMKRIYNRRG